jgi:diguanylate cyclase (GGDEF)-like protein
LASVGLTVVTTLGELEPFFIRHKSRSTARRAIIGRFRSIDAGAGRINDSNSHAAGDEVLKTVARVIRDSVRESDLPARLGGDEFVILFRRTTIETARQVCDRVGTTISGLRWPQLKPLISVRVSIGVAQARAGDTPATLLQRSDLAMFEAKAAARA